MATNQFRAAAEAELNKRTEIAQQFVQFYYSLFDHVDRSQVLQLGNLYVRRITVFEPYFLNHSCSYVISQNDQSMLTFEDGKFFGKQEIMEKITVCLTAEIPSLSCSRSHLGFAIPEGHP